MYQESRLSVLDLLLRTVDHHNIRTTLARGEGNARVSFRFDVLNVDVFLSEQFAVKLMGNQYCLVHEVAILDITASITENGNGTDVKTFSLTSSITESFKLSRFIWFLNGVRAMTLSSLSV